MSQRRFGKGRSVTVAGMFHGVLRIRKEKGIRGEVVVVK
jgi:hypothetical protein